MQIIRLKKQQSPARTSTEAIISRRAMAGVRASAGTCRKKDKVQPKRESDQRKDHKEAVRRRYALDRKRETCRVEEPIGGGQHAARVDRSDYA